MTTTAAAITADTQNARNLRAHAFNAIHGEAQVWDRITTSQLRGQSYGTVRKYAQLIAEGAGLDANDVYAAALANAA